MLHSHIYKLDNNSIEIKLSLRAKYTQIKIIGAQAKLIIPKIFSYDKAIAFLHSKKDWINSKLAKNDSDNVSNTNCFLKQHKGYLFGKLYFLRHTNSKTIKIIDDKIILNLEKNNTDFKLKIFFKMWLHQEILALVLSMTTIIGVMHSNITIKKMRTRWGSCNSKKQLTFNEKLIFTDFSIIKYLVAHEVSHLIEMNHSKNFWAIVDKLDPNWRNSRKWLKRHGSIVLN